MKAYVEIGCTDDNGNVAADAELLDIDDVKVCLVVGIDSEGKFAALWREGADKFSRMDVPMPMLEMMLAQLASIG